ncbi:hypothetical protein KSP40_PGU006592 [Platanthera guangdongensis]|uniref:Uncharacterized protein n=1 Tax=Platanthera guangdongensis TaxID=2320717 RepID=A0ABR2LQY2_9ASPA
MTECDSMFKSHSKERSLGISPFRTTSHLCGGLARKMSSTHVQRRTYTRGKNEILGGNGARAGKDRWWMVIRVQRGGLRFEEA